MRIRSALVSVVTGAAVAGALYACGDSSRNSGFGDADGDIDGASSSGFLPQGEGGDGPTACKGIACNVVNCGSGAKTTLSGTVYAPTPAQYGKADPIYNAILYVPNSELKPFPQGVSCDKCGTITSGEPIV